MIETHRSFLIVTTSDSFSRWEADFERLDLEILRSIQWKAIVIDEHQHSEIANELEQIKMLSTEMRIILVSDHIKLDIRLIPAFNTIDVFMLNKWIV
ncbi:hypothetical protein C2S51_015233 [Perilla frutescens var. frutescens]|nr:hypothetical protein C2S51_015233 [Perilla frutescens var. frutescens]